MNPYKAYQQQPPTVQPRIDVILALYEAAISRLEKVLDGMRRNDQASVEKQLAASKFAVTGLTSASLGRKGELAFNLRRLFGFVMDCLADGRAEKLLEAIKVLRTLHDGFVSIRPEAIEMERSGQIPPLNQAPSFQVNA